MLSNNEVTEGLLIAVLGENPTHSYHRMGSSGVEDCVTSFSVALETGQSGVIAGVTHGVV